MDERRADDRWMRETLSQRLMAIETTQKLYHDEVKSITDDMHHQLNALKDGQMALHYTLYGGPQADHIGLLERFRTLLFRAGLITTAGFGLISFLLKLFSPSLNKVALRMVGEDPVSQYKMEQSKRRIQVWNPKDKRFEYFIEFTPVGTKKEQE